MAAWPAVKAAIADGAKTLPEFSGVDIYLGMQATDDGSLKRLEVGFVNDENNAGTYTRSPIYDGSVWGESGEVRSTIVAQAGDSDPSIAEGQAFEMADALEAWVQANRTLNDALSDDSEVHTSVDVLSTSNANGTATELILTLTYTTTT